MELDLTIVLHREKHQPKTENFNPCQLLPNDQTINMENHEQDRKIETNPAIFNR